MTYTLNRDTTALQEAVRFVNLSPPSQGAHVVRGHGRTYSHITVKNLGWLLRHASEVTHLYVFAPIIPHPDSDAVLVALLEDGTAYSTMFADRNVLVEWLRRPSLRHVQADWRIPKLRARR